MKDVNFKINHFDNWISDYLNRPLDRIVQYRHFLQVNKFRIWISKIKLSNLFVFNCFFFHLTYRSK